MNGKPIEVALAFVKAVNAASVAKLAGLMTEDHEFVDSDGGVTRGRASMTAGWEGYFAMVPDYRIAVQDAFGRGGTVALTGEAEGTFVQGGSLKRENHWKVPAAWRAVIKGGQVAVWQVYVNPEPMSEILKRIKGA